ncbi:MAG TPA: zf-HC2 domain-containing protein [Jatrophihabitantaceae bacterium]|nr:zf-HC2 domain-containing protein [Jatrophihabitantaceae bacterium]
MHATDQRMAAYLAGELDVAGALAVDEHLLSCETCWQAVCAARQGRRAAERLREPAPLELADRIGLAIDLAPDPAPMRARRGRWLALATATVALIAAVVTAALLVPNQSTRHDPAVISALVHVAAQPTLGESGSVSTELGGQPVVLRHYQVEGGAVVVATSTLAFPMPSGVHAGQGAPMAWTITRDTVTVYCPSGRVLLAGPVPARTLVALAERLHFG